VSKYYHHYKNVFGMETRVCFDEHDSYFVVTEEHRFNECSTIEQKKREAVDFLILKLKNELAGKL
jgi:hypothetical protein